LFFNKFSQKYNNTFKMILFLKNMSIFGEFFQKTNIKRHFTKQ